MEAQESIRETLSDILHHAAFGLVGGIVVGQSPDVDISHLTLRRQFAIEQCVALSLEQACIKALLRQVFIDLRASLRKQFVALGNTLRFPNPVNQILFIRPLVFGQPLHGRIAYPLQRLLLRQLMQMLPLRCTRCHRQPLATPQGDLKKFENQHSVYILKGIWSLRSMALMNWGTFQLIFISLMRLG